MQDICNCNQYNLPCNYDTFTISKDKIGWHQFLEGMFLYKLLSLLYDIILQPGHTMDLENRMAGLITQFLEITHNLWIYRNVVVHDDAAGIHAMRWRALLQTEIEQQVDLGSEGLGETNQCMLERNLST